MLLYIIHGLNSRLYASNLNQPLGTEGGKKKQKKRMKERSCTN